MYNPHQGMKLPLKLLIRLFVGFWVGLSETYLHHIMLQNQRADPKRFKLYNLIKMCMHVYRIYLVGFIGTYLCMTLFISLLIFEVWAIFIYLFCMDFHESTFLSSSLFSSHAFEHGFDFSLFSVFLSFLFSFFRSRL